MREQGTFLGEVERGWQRFWGLSWWWKGPIIGFVAFFLLGAVVSIFGGGDEDESASSVESTSSPTITASPQETVVTAAASETTPPTPTPELTAEPTAVPLNMVQQLTKSYEDEQNFMIRASDDELNVQWLPELGGLVKIEIKTLPFSNGDFLTITAHSALVASKAIWSAYPDVEQIELTLLGDFTDQFGASTTGPAAAMTVFRATGEQIDYDGMEGLVYGDNKHLFCVADHYQIAPSIYQKLGDKGCLAAWGFAK